MQLTTGTVVEGKIVVEGYPLAEGSVVTILSRRATSHSCALPKTNKLLAAMAEIDRGEFVSADELLESLRKNG